jgi:hypothetical protein
VRVVGAGGPINTRHRLRVRVVGAGGPIKLCVGLQNQQEAKANIRRTNPTNWRHRQYAGHTIWMQSDSLWAAEG